MGNRRNQRILRRLRLKRLVGLERWKAVALGVGWEAVQAHLFCCCKGVNCRNMILVVQIHFNVWKKVFTVLPLTIDCESTMEVSRVDMDMLGDSLLLWCEITCWNTKFGLIDWRGIQNMTSGIFYRKTTWVYIPRAAIAKRFLQKKNRIESNKRPSPPASSTGWALTFSPPAAQLLRPLSFCWLCTDSRFQTTIPKMGNRRNQRILRLLRLKRLVGLERWKAVALGCWVGWEAVQAHLFCCCKGVNCRDTILVVQMHFNVWKKVFTIDHWLRINHGIMEASRVDMDMLGDSLLLWCEITCWNTKFGLTDWLGILNMTLCIF